MVFKKLLHSISGKKAEDEKQTGIQEIHTLIDNDLFPVYRAADIDMDKYDKFPLLGMAALGASLSQLPSSTRTMVQTVLKFIPIKETLFVGINAKGVPGYMRENEFGTVGNILQRNEKGQEVIAGRMRFKAIGNNLPVVETTTTTIPFDPNTMVIAAALYQIDQKLTAIQKTVDDILRFLSVDKQSKQRGNLNTLNDLLEEYKLNFNNEKWCALHNADVLTIKRESQQNILFYQEQIAQKMKQQSAIHIAQHAQQLLIETMDEFNEYQLSCYLFAFASYMDILLQRSFDKATLQRAMQKIQEISARYLELYQICHKQLKNYKKSALEVQLLGGLGSAAKSLGRAIASVPVLRDGNVDEALIGFGDNIDKTNNERMQAEMEEFQLLEENRMNFFLDSIQTVDLLYHEERAMLTEGEHLYVLKKTRQNQPELHSEKGAKQSAE